MATKGIALTVIPRSPVRKQVPIPKGVPEGKDIVYPRPTIPTTTTYQPYTPQQILSWSGTLTNGVDTGQFSFFVLAGDGAPTITGGWVKLAIVDRIQRLGVTLAQGFDPVTMDVPIMFENVVRQPAGKGAIGHPQDPANIEADIQALEWMAGRGKDYAAPADSGVGHPATGDPPIVRVASYLADGTESNLIPPNVQGVNWLISNIAYDPNPIRDKYADRTRQKAIVSLTEFVSSPGTSTYDSPAVRAKARNGSKPVTFVTTDGINTIKKILQAKNRLSAANERTVISYNLSRLHIASATKTLRRGTTVLIPASVIDQ